VYEITFVPTPWALQVTKFSTLLGLQRFLKTLSCAILKKKNLDVSSKLRTLIMVYCHISKDLKECALWLISHGYAPKDICELFDIFARSVTRWKQNDCLYGSVIPPPNPKQCHPRILNGNMMHNLYTLLEEAPEMYLSEIQDWIALAYEVQISKAALHRNNLDASITYKLLCKAAAERDEDLWQEWKQDIKASAFKSGPQNQKRPELDWTMTDGNQTIGPGLTKK
jgi:transposase